jgi:hypothetical protein
MNLSLRQCRIVEFDLRQAITSNSGQPAFGREVALSQEAKQKENRGITA